MKKRSRHLSQNTIGYCCWPSCGARRYKEIPLCSAHLKVAHGLQAQIEAGRMPTTRVTVEADAAPPAREPVVRPAKPGHVYFVQVGEHIKIGWTADLGQRMRSYPPNAILLAVEPGTRADEARLHRRFAVHRTHGREWYAPVPAVKGHVKAVKAQHGEPPTVIVGAREVEIPQPREPQPIRGKTLARKW